MTMSAIIVFGLGAAVLWGGFIVTLGITIYNEKKQAENI
ncbi:MetS family NSS transporter small subunit [Clostridium neonatale]|nr:Conserved hypothetical protein [Clostridium neonatale]CAI3623397.1 Conserved hypothetical protein [Clostridium neonatale]CAI3634925.1 Conserved hypothetical protein [Clostridium neonatale]CAI3644128.1 Conserved hypothetical protein [Clostridium neonatale]CAI3652584.1 Conserved hypothetical protein [Clostridium neonatale]